MVTARTPARRTGDAAEDAALTALQAAGLTLITRNWLVRGGEIDLICRERDTLVFVEVRSRASSAFGGALASVTTAKQRRLVIAAQCFLQQHPPLSRLACRFDVVAVSAGRVTDWIRDAFQLAD